MSIYDRKMERFPEESCNYFLMSADIDHVSYCPDMKTMKETADQCEWNVPIVTPYLENVFPSPVKCMNIFKKKIPWLSVKNWEGSFKFCCFQWLHAVLQIYAMQTWLVVHSSMFHHLNLSWIYGLFEQLMDIKQRLNPIQPQPSLSLIPLLLLSFITRFYVSLFIWITQCNAGEFFLFSPFVVSPFIVLCSCFICV